MKRMQIAMLLFFLFAVQTAKTQNSTTVDSIQKINTQLNTIYFNTGTSLIYSAFIFTYERNLFNNEKAAFNLLAGWGLNQPFWGPVTHHYVLSFGRVSGKNKHHLETNLGLTCFFDRNYYQYYNYDTDVYEPLSYFLNLYPSAYIGYRYHKPMGRFLFRAGIGWPEQAGVGFGVVF